MPTDPERNAIWNWALGNVVLDRPLKFSEAATSVRVELSQETVTDVVNVMSGYGWLNEVSSLHVDEINKYDAIWNCALRKAVSGDSIRVPEIKRGMETEEDVSRTTVRDTLNAMEEYSWLKRENKWMRAREPGPRVRDLEYPKEQYEGKVLGTNVNPENAFTVDALREGSIKSDECKVTVEIDGHSRPVTHGKTGKTVLIPYRSGEPVTYTIPRLGGEDRVISIDQVRKSPDNQSKEARTKLLLPRLDEGDHIEITGENLTKECESTDKVKLVAFRNVDSLVVEAKKLTDEEFCLMKAVIEINELSSGIAHGSIEDTKVEKKTEEVDSQNSGGEGNKNPGIRSAAGDYRTWEERKKAYQSETKGYE